MKEVDLSKLVVINQEPDGMALMTLKAWEAHKKWVLGVFLKETDSDEAQELFDHYISSFNVQEATRKNYNFLTKCCKLVVNESKEIESFVGDIHRF